MQVYRALAEVPPARKNGRVVAIGVFDGVHLGHQRILGEAVDRGRETGAATMALTFEPHPETVLRLVPAPRLLTPLERKIELVEALGVEEMMVIRFDREFAKWPPADFCRNILAEPLGARLVVVGEGFRFGHRGEGTVEDLQRCGGRYGFAVKAIPLAEESGETISSTRIRRLVSAGRVNEAAALLGRPHRIEGVVVRGAGRGRALEAPTANLAVDRDAAIPKNGVYVTRSIVDGDAVRPSVTSVGTNPTFEADHKLRIETFFLDGEADVYGRRMAVDFLEWIRAQEVFKDGTALAARIKEDVAISRAFLGARGDLV